MEELVRVWDGSFVLLHVTTGRFSNAFLVDEYPENESELVLLQDGMLLFV